MGLPQPLLSFTFVFSNKHYKFLQQINVKNCPSSIRRRDSNYQPSDYESLPLTTRPGLPPCDCSLPKQLVLFQVVLATPR